MATKGYQTYRGRMPRWKKALMAVLVLILIGACAFLVLQKYQVFDADGIHLRLPGDENEPAPESAQPLPEEDLVIDEKEPEVRELHGRTLDAAALPEETFSVLLDGESPVKSFWMMCSFRITAGRSALYMSRGKTAMRAALRRSMLFWMR